MDFSSDWVKPGPVMTTEPLVTARLELVRTGMSQVARYLSPETSQEPEKLEHGSQQRLHLAAPRAWRSGLRAPAFVSPALRQSIPWLARRVCERRLWFCRSTHKWSEFCRL